jgi:hypothetical protein
MVVVTEDNGIAVIWSLRMPLETLSPYRIIVSTLNLALIMKRLPL